jgi:HNH endonuclease/AP2 domain
MNPKISIEELRRLFSYDPLTGVIKWRVARQRIKAESPAGCLDGHGYTVIGINGSMHQAHQIAWALHHGDWSTGGLDHRNLCKSDNRIDNLRPASQSQNGANRAPSRNNTSGHKGVTWNKRSGKWQASIVVRQRRIHLGLFCDIKAAGNAYAEAAVKHFGQFARSTS